MTKANFFEPDLCNSDGKEESHLDTTIMVIDKSNLAQHVSGNNFAHPQEH